MDSGMLQESNNLQCM